MKRKFDEMMNSSSLDELLNKKHMKDEPYQKSDTCPICMEKIGNTNITITKCGHKFCHVCLDEHSSTNNKCPLCRENMDTKIKNKNICNCHIRQSVNKALTESNHHLNNLCKRLIKKFFNMLHKNKLEFENICDSEKTCTLDETCSNKLDTHDETCHHECNNHKENQNNELKNELKNEEFNYLICKIINKLNNIDNFKHDLYKYFYEEIFYFSLVNSNHVCINLKSIIETNNLNHNH